MSRNKDKLRRKQTKNIKIFLKMKKTKGEKSPERYHDFTEEEKEKKLENYLSMEHKMKQAEYRKNYYLRHEK